MPRKTRKQMVGKKKENERICEDGCLLEQIEAELHREWLEELQHEEGEVDDPDDEEYGSDVERW